jgi:hypothetical protein
MNILAAIKREERKLEKQLKKVQHQLDGVRSAAKALGHTVAVEAKGSNLLLRQYFPRGTDLSGYSQEQLDQVSLLLNQRPRKTLGFHTPADKLQARVASSA